jgi:hypothetical protein
MKNAFFTPSLQGYRSKSAKRPCSVVFLLGPGLGAWTRVDGAVWRQSLLPVRGHSFAAGDGEGGLSLEAIERALVKAAACDQRATIVLQAHGEPAWKFPGLTDGSAFVFQNKATGLLSSRFFFDLTKKLFEERAVDIVLSSCHAGYAMADMDCLSRGSRLVVFSPPSLKTPVAHARWCFDYVGRAAREAISAETIMDAFIASAWTWPRGSDPAMGLVGEGIEIPRKALAKLIARKPNAEEREALSVYLDQHGLDAQGCRKVLAMIHQAQTLREIDLPFVTWPLAAARALDRTLYSLAAYARWDREYAALLARMLPRRPNSAEAKASPPATNTIAGPVGTLP